MPNVDNLDVVLGLNTNPFKKSVKGFNETVKRSLDDVKDKVSKASGAFGRMGGSLRKVTSLLGPYVAAVGAAVSVTSAFRGIMDAFARNDSLGKTADRLGLTVQELQIFQIAAERSNVAISSMEMSIQRMNRRIADARDGAGPAADALEEMGLSAQELINKTPAESFSAISKAILSVENQAVRTSLAFAIFDTEGGKLLETMKDGATGFAGAREELDKLGSAINDLDAAKAAAVNDAFGRVGETIKGVFNRLSSQLAPAFLAAAEAATVLIKRLQATAAGGEVMGSLMVTAIKAIASAVHGLLILWDGLQAGLLTVARVGVAALNSIVKAVGTVAVRVEGLYDFLKEGIKQPEVAWQMFSQGIKALFLNTLADMASAMKEWAIVVSGPLTAISEEAGKALQQAAISMSSTLNVAATESGVAFENLQKRVSSSFPEMADAARRAFGELQNEDFSHMFISLEESLDSTGTVLNEKMTEAFQSIRDTAMMFGGDTAWGFVTSAHESFIESWEEARAEIMNTLNNTFDEGAEAARAGGILMGSTWADWMKLSMEERLNSINQIFNNLTSLMQSESRTLFEIGKAAGIASATIDTYIGANKALASLPFPLNIAAAGAVIAAGVVNVQRIASTSFGKGAGPSASSPGAGVVNQTSGGGGGGEATATQTTQFNVNLQGQNFSGEQVRGLIGMINDQTGDGVDLKANMS